jgi:hypothetical protein
MNWNMTVEDFAFIMKLEPQGCFVLFQGQERIGIATSISYGKVGWLGNLIVKEAFRREDAGSLLVQHAISYLKKQGMKTIGLYAYPHLVKFYERFGFESDSDFLVLRGKPASTETLEILRETKKQDIPELASFDRQCFQGDRKKLLEAILLNPANSSYISVEGNEISGYAAAKVYGKMAEVGPLICRSDRVEAAVILLKALLSRLSSLDVFMCFPEKEAALLSVLREAGFQEDFRVVRMFLGPAVAKNCIYIAESLERG